MPRSKSSEDNVFNPSFDSKSLFGIRGRPSSFPQRRPRVDDDLYQAKLPPFYPLRKKQKFFTKSSSTFLTTQISFIEKKRNRLDDKIKLRKIKKRGKNKRNVNVETLLPLDRYFSKQLEREGGDVNQYLKFCEKMSRLSSLDSHKHDHSWNVNYSEELCLRLLHICGYDIGLAKFRLISSLGGCIQEVAVRDDLPGDSLFEKYCPDYAHNLENSEISINRYEKDNEIYIETTKILVSDAKIWANQVKLLASDKNISKPFHRADVVKLLEYGLGFESMLKRLVEIKSTETLQLESSSTVNHFENDSRNGFRVDKRLIYNRQQQVTHEAYRTEVNAISMIKRIYRKLLIFLSRAHDIAAFPKSELSACQKYGINDVDDILVSPPKNIEIPEIIELGKIRGMWKFLEGKLNYFLKAVNRNLKVTELIPTYAEVHLILRRCQEEGIGKISSKKILHHLKKADILTDRFNKLFTINLFSKPKDGIPLIQMLALKKDFDDCGIKCESVDVLNNLIIKANEWILEFDEVFINRGTTIKQLISLRKKSEKIPVNFGKRKTILDLKIRKAQKWLTKVKLNLKTSVGKFKQTRSTLSGKDAGYTKIDILSLKAFRVEAAYLGLDENEIDNLNKLIEAVETWLRETSMTIISSENSVAKFSESNNTKTTPATISSADLACLRGSIEVREVIKELEFLRCKSEEFAIDLTPEIEYISVEIEFYSFWNEFVSRIFGKKLSLKQLKSKFQELRNMKTSKLPPSCGFLNLKENKLEKLDIIRSDQVVNGLTCPQKLDGKSWKISFELYLESLVQRVEAFIKFVSDVSAYMHLDESTWCSKNSAEKEKFLIEREESFHLYDLDVVRNLLVQAETSQFNLNGCKNILKTAILAAGEYISCFTLIFENAEKIHYNNLRTKYINCCRLGILAGVFQKVRRELIIANIWYAVAVPIVTLCSCEVISDNPCKAEDYCFFSIPEVQNLLELGKHGLFVDCSFECDAMTEVLNKITQIDLKIKKLLQDFDEASEKECLSLPLTTGLVYNFNAPDMLEYLNLKPGEQEYTQFRENILDANFNSSSLPEELDSKLLIALEAKVENMIHYFDSLMNDKCLFLVQNLKSFKQLRRILLAYNWIKCCSTITKPNQEMPPERISLNDLLIRLCELLNLSKCARLRNKFLFIDNCYDNQGLDKFYRKLSWLGLDYYQDLNIPLEKMAVEIRQDLVDLNKRSIIKDEKTMSSIPSVVDSHESEAVHSNFRPRRCIKPTITIDELRNPFSGYTEVLQKKGSESENQHFAKLEDGTVTSSQSNEGKLLLNKFPGLVKVLVAEISQKEQSQYRHLKTSFFKTESMLLSGDIECKVPDSHSLVVNKDSLATRIGGSFTVPTKYPAAYLALHWMQQEIGMEFHGKGKEPNLPSCRYIELLLDIYGEYLIKRVRLLMMWRWVSISLLKHPLPKQSLHNNSYESYKYLLLVWRKYLCLHVEIKEVSKLEQEIAVVDNWIMKSRKFLEQRIVRSNQEKITEIDLEKLISEGLKLKGFFPELDQLSSIREDVLLWFKRVKSCGIETGNFNINTLRALLEQANHLPVDLSRHTKKIRACTQVFCVCRYPKHLKSENLIFCDTCDGMFHSACVDSLIVITPQGKYFNCLRCRAKRKLKVCKGVAKVLHVRVELCIETVEDNDSYDRNGTSRDYHFFKRYGAWVQKCFEMIFDCNLKMVEEFEVSIGSYEKMINEDNKSSVLKVLEEFSVFRTYAEAQLLLKTLFLSFWCIKVDDLFLKNNLPDRDFVLDDVKKAIDFANAIQKIHTYAIDSCANPQQSTSSEQPLGLSFLEKMYHKSHQWLEAYSLFDFKTASKSEVLEKCKHLCLTYRDLLLKFPSKLHQLEAIIEDDANKHCVCDGFNNGQFMINCETCNRWYHGKCIGISEIESIHIQSWTCTSCRNKNIPFEIIKVLECIMSSLREC